MLHPATGMVSMSIVKIAFFFNEYLNLNCAVT